MTESENKHNRPNPETKRQRNQRPVGQNEPGRPEQLKQHLEIRTLPYGPLESCSHVIRIGSSSILIDPSIDPQRLPESWPKPDLLIATHGHLDHIDGADVLRDFCQAKLAIHYTEEGSLINPKDNLSVYMGMEKTFRKADLLLKEGQIITLDEQYSLEVLHTPGHSMGSICLLLTGPEGEIALFSGDTLFAGSVGRSDLPGGDSLELIKSLQKLSQRLNKPETQKLPIYPGHGPATVWNREKANNSYLNR